MGQMQAGWAIQQRVIVALVRRELATRFGRENIGFLWMMAEPLLFPALVALGWRLLRGPSEHGLSVIAFVVTGYVPLTLFRHAVGRSVGVFSANSGLLYHRQIGLVDLIFVRVLIEVVGAMMAYVGIAGLLIWCGAFPVPADMGMLVAGWLLYALVTCAVCLVLAPLSEMSDVLEKLIPAVTYVMVPFAGTFNLVSWLAPGVRPWMLFSPFVDAMEMMRAGVFGDSVRAYYNVSVPLYVAMGLGLVGLILCRHVRRALVVQ